MPMPLAQLVCSGASFSYGPLRVLNNIMLTVAPGDKIGLVGANGTGKTTLLRLLASRLDADEGLVTAQPARATVGLVTQLLDDGPGETVSELLKRLTGVQAVTDDFEAALDDVAQSLPGAADHYDVALERYLDADGPTFDQRMVETFDAVGLGDVPLNRLTRELSGGQRTRLNLASVLLARFDVLLLDEPTNDLDLVGLQLLEEMLVNEARPLVFVSHDRAFLDRVATSIFELDAQTREGTRYNGGFATWERDRAIALRHEHEAFADYESKRAALQGRAQIQQQWSARGVARVKRDGSQRDKNIRAYRIATSEKVASKSKQTQRALERLERDEKVDAPWEPWELQLTFDAADRSGREVATLHNASIERGDWKLGPLTISLAAGDRVRLTGANGSGKTTLLGALFGEIPLSTGMNRVGSSVHRSTLRQHRELFVDAPSLLQGFGTAAGCDDTSARSQLAKLGLDADRVARPATELSPGECTRAALGLFAITGANLLVLDEPTNHLDLPAIEELEAAIAVFPHTVVLVSHDRRLLDRFEASRWWHLVDGQLVER